MTNPPPEHAHPHGFLSLLMSMIGTRVELAALDAEAHLKATVSAMLAAFVALVLALVAFVFVGIAVIVIFWDTHRLAAALGVTGAYVLLAVFIAFWARSAWNSRPSAFAATLRELELDRAAFRSQT